MMNEKQVFSENMRINKFCDENEKLFIAEISDENNHLSYQEIFDKYKSLYKEFALKHNSDKRNIYTKLSLDSFEKHFKSIENPTKLSNNLNIERTFEWRGNLSPIEYAIHCEMYPSIINWHDKKYIFWLSIKNKYDCLFSRRIGIKGRLLFDKSIRLRLFGIDIM